MLGRQKPSLFCLLGKVLGGCWGAVVCLAGEGAEKDVVGFGRA